ncbi:GxxExxY protein [Alistipes sp. ZOR0009]|uniref:GxxExxY protein n=1 Tax=Alistipes sp. ZOR0009 TaxID=1339253 RepID=UPI000647340A|nr:GxxExxY protein [Alistipes sp. ZOR0009]
MSEVEYNKLTDKILASAIEVHRILGPGLLESVYEYCLVEELRRNGLNVQRQVKLPIIYKGRNLEKDFFIDLLVEDKVVIELKAVEEVLPVHEVQLRTYLKLSEKKLGLLINFHVPILKQGVKRKINGVL